MNAVREGVSALTNPSAPPVRVITVWIPDWPIVAYLRSTAREIGAADRPEDSDPIALFHGNTVVACNQAARNAGVSRAQRRRDAQAACPALRIARADESRDARSFHDVLAVLERLSPGVQPLRPGLAALRARGPARFYRGERSAAEALLGALAHAGFPHAHAGIADGIFTAEQAARSAGTRADSPPIAIVPPGGAADFLAPLPVTALGDRDIALLLARLGIRTLGGFTQLSPELVHDRLGDHGLRLRALASGADSRHVSPMPPPTEIVREIAFEPPLDMAEQVAFAVRQTAEAFCNAAAAEGLIVTAVRITIESDLGGRSERIWQHPEHFDAASVVDRVRWQLEAEARHKAPVQAQLSPSESALPGGASRVLIEPEAVDAATAHQPTLIGQGPDERSHHAMTRLQSTLGHEGVLTPTLAGGRFLAEREVLVPWGDAQTSDRDPALPWPGSLPDPLPTEIFRLPRSVRVSGAAGAEVRVDERGLLTAPPAEIAGKAVTGWAGPWPVVEHTWDVDRARHAHRFQVIDASGDAWLVVLENGEWWLEGKYS